MDPVGSITTVTIYTVLPETPSGVKLTAAPSRCRPASLLRRGRSWLCLLGSGTPTITYTRCRSFSSRLRICISVLSLCFNRTGRSSTPLAREKLGSTVTEAPPRVGCWWVNIQKRDNQIKQRRCKLERSVLSRLSSLPTPPKKLVRSRFGALCFQGLL